MKIIEGKEWFRIPQWVQMLIMAFSLMLAAIVVFQASAPKSQAIFQAKPKPEIYIINRSEVLNFDGQTVYVLEYAADGLSQMPVTFSSEKERFEFEGWLYQVGRRAR